MAKHGFDSVTIKLSFRGPDVEQEMQVVGPRLGQHDDIAKYIGEVLAPKLEAVSAPGNITTLREQVATLEKSINTLTERNAQLEAAEAARQKNKRQSAKTHPADAADDL